MEKDLRLPVVCLLFPSQILANASTGPPGTEAVHFTQAPEWATGTQYSAICCCLPWSTLTGRGWEPEYLDRNQALQHA